MKEHRYDTLPSHILIRALLIGLLIPLLCLGPTGCAPRTPMPNIKAEYYPQCYTPFVKLHEAQVALQNRTISYTAGGAAVGAMGGALLGLLTSGGNWRGALIGAVAGGVSGATTGYTLAKVQEIKDQQQRYLAYRLSMNTDLKNATDLEIAASQSLACYIREFEKLQQDLAAHAITKEEFSKRYAEIRMGITEIGKITGASHTLLTQREAEYRTALQSEGSKRKFSTVDDRRAKERAKQAAIYKKARKSKKKKSKRAVEPVAAPSPTLASLRDDLAQQEQQAVLEGTRYQQNIQMDAPPASNKGDKDATPASAPAKQAVSMDQVADTYDVYPDRVLQMEKLEKLRVETMNVMNDAATKTGIDMVMNDMGTGVNADKV